MAVLASASVPGLFPPVTFDGHLLIDGGTAYNTNVEQAILRCREIGAEDASIILDILVASEDSVDGLDDDSPGEKTKVSHSGLTNYLRGRSISRFTRDQNSIAAVRRAHPDIQFRYMIK